jgi:hypothetical protein
MRLGGSDLGPVGVAKNENMKPVARPGRGKSFDQSSEIARQPARILIAYADQDRGSRNDRLVAADSAGEGRDDRDWITDEPHQDEADHRIPEADDRPWQSHGKDRDHQQVKPAE